MLLCVSQFSIDKSRSTSENPAVTSAKSFSDSSTQRPESPLILVPAPMTVKTTSVNQWVFLVGKKKNVFPRRPWGGRQKTTQQPIRNCRVRRSGSHFSDAHARQDRGSRQEARNKDRWYAFILFQVSLFIRMNLGFNF